MLLHESHLKEAVIGGAILGGGGGGSCELGLSLGNLALSLNAPKLIKIDELHPDSLIVTVSAVGAPSAKQSKATPMDYVKAIKLLEQHIGKKIEGIITNENGGTATINGWIQSALLGIPLIDAPCNGRAHPTGMMGSMGLHKVEGFISHQAAIGGDPELKNHLELTISSTLKNSSALIRNAADTAGGLVAVARNPVKASYVKEHAALGAISHAINTGKAFFEGITSSPQDAINNVVSFLAGKVITQGTVINYHIETKNAFDVGFLNINGYELTFWNEYMTLDIDGQRIGTFPDLIMTLDSLTGYPVTTAEIQNNQQITVIVIPKENLKLGAGVKDASLLKDIEHVINRKIID